MRLGTNIKDTIDVNKTVNQDNKAKSPNPVDQKQDLNMTAPIVEHIKND